MLRFTSRLSAAAPMAALALLVCAAGSYAQNTQTIERGRTTATLASSFVSALGSLGVTPGTVSPTQLHGATVDFPVTGGAIDLDTAAGQILHSGRARRSLPGRQRSYSEASSSIRLRLLSSPVWYPWMAGWSAVLPLFLLDSSSGITLPLEPDYAEFSSQTSASLSTVPPLSALNSVFKISRIQGWRLDHRNREGQHRSSRLRPRRQYSQLSSPAASRTSPTPPSSLFLTFLKRVARE